MTRDIAAGFGSTKVGPKTAGGSAAQQLFDGAAHRLGPGDFFFSAEERQFSHLLCGKIDNRAHDDDIVVRYRGEVKTTDVRKQRTQGRME